MKTRLSRGRAATAALVLCAQLVVLLSPAVVPRAVQAQPAKPPVERGQEYYEQSRFDEAIGLLRDLVDKGMLSGDDLLKAREILARSYVKKGYPVQAKDMFKAILGQNPAYRPDPIRVPPDETAIFEQALREFQTEQPSQPQQPTVRDTVKAAPPPPSTVSKPTPPPAPTVVPVQEGGKKGGSKKLWYILGGVVVAGGIAAAAGGGGGGGGGKKPPPPPLGFPGPPTP